MTLMIKVTPIIKFFILTVCKNDYNRFSGILILKLII